MTKSQKIKIFVKAYDKYRIIEDDADLRKNKLTVPEYRVVAEGLKFLSTIDDKVFITFMSGVAKWFESNGFKVVKEGNSVNYQISIA